MKTIAKILSVIITLSISFWINTYAESSDTLSTNINNQIAEQLTKLNTNNFDSFSVKILKNNDLVLENWVWYTYVYSKYLSTWKWLIPNKNDIIDAWINKDTDILLLDEEIWVWFIHDYKKVKLINDEIISGISNKSTFLKELADEKKYLQEDTDELFKSLKNDTNTITDWLNNWEKISSIYNFILKNTSYSKTFDISNKRIFSWIYTYKNNDWICTWYSKLALYMLSFAWIENVEVVRWNVIDIENFTDAWHAWIKIWDKYFDPTFDDPIWNIKTKTYKDYKYFWLPKDLFYSNRYEYGTLPSDLVNSSLSYRKNIVSKNLEKLAIKYSDKTYNLLKNIVSKNSDDLSYNY